jgi:outer membrane putative beta-barrel porin/alpha-amylase
MHSIRVIAVACALHAGASFGAQRDEITLGGGVHYSEGDYGTGSSTTITALTFTGRYDTGQWSLRGSVPYLFISGSNAVVPGVGRARSAPATSTSSVAGLGDVTLAAVYSAYYNAARELGVDVSGKLKLATADPDKRLGTGEHDVGVLAEVFKVFGRVTAFAGLGYTMFGSTPTFPLDDVFNYTLGASYRVDERDSVGAYYDERERVTSSAAPLRELTAFWSRRLDRAWKAQAYVLKGFANGSPDWGAGLSAAYSF